MAKKCEVSSEPSASYNLFVGGCHTSSICKQCNIYEAQ